MKNSRFIKGAIILIIFNLIGKIVGAIYRIPLANLLGPVGIGKYQLIFPLFSLLLSVSTSGIPIAISKMVAEFNEKHQYENSKKLLKIAIFYLFIVSVVCSGIVVLFSKRIARFQGNPDIYLCYYGLVPAILFVGGLSVFRGYFQGNLMMVPTALSGLIEQVGKLVFGLFFAYKLLSKGLVFGVLGAVVGISLSELAAFVFLFVFYLCYKNKQKGGEACFVSRKMLSKRLVSFAVPVTLGGIAAPITSIIDSLLVINLLQSIGLETEKATSLIGLQSGIVEPIINIPIVIAVSISASLLPNLSKEFVAKQTDKVKQLIEKAFQITLSVSLACAICFVVFGKQILGFLYSKSLSNEELKIATKLLFLGGLNLIFLSLVQVSSGVLQGVGKQNISAKSIIVGCVIKICLTFVLVGFSQINIYGAMISGFVDYLIVFLINYKAIKQFTCARISNVYFKVSIQECFVCLFAFFTNFLISMAFNSSIALFIGGSMAVVIFSVTYYILFFGERQTKSVSS